MKTALAQRQQPSHEKSGDHRDPFQKDKCSVLHSFSFRRLGCKMQIYGNYNSDFHRTRLTHSLEVASISKHIGINLKQKSNTELKSLFADPESPYCISEDHLETLGLLHDIGHPPFGHGGEIALNCILNRYSQGLIGFEGNGQTLRIAKKLNLSRRTLLGLMKYPIAYQRALKDTFKDEMRSLKDIPEYDIEIRNYVPPKCYYDQEQALVDWIFAPFSKNDQSLFFQPLNTDPTEHKMSQYKSFDCSIMDLADDITYSMHDLEDAVFLRLLQEHELSQFSYHNKTLNEYFAAIHWQSEYLQACDNFVHHLFSDEGRIILSYLINEFIVHTEIVQTAAAFDDPLFKYNVSLPEDMLEFIMALKEAIHAYVIFSQENQSIVYGGQILVMKIFEALNANPMTLLSEKDRELFTATNDYNKQLRIISDYIAGMTDQYAQHLYQRLYGLNLRSIFERL